MRCALSCLASLVLTTSLGEAYTNLAGRTLSGTPVKIERGEVTFRCGAAAHPRVLPLDVFLPSERLRIKRAVGLREMPAALKDLADEITAQRTRAEARAEAGRLTPEKLADFRENLAASWRHAVDETALPPDDKSYWKGHLP